MDLARLGLGALALGWPRTVLQASGSADRPWPRRLTRVLGARYLVQSAAGLAVADRRVLLADGAVELTHAASTVPIAMLVPDYRTLSLGSGALAVAFGTCDLIAWTRR